MILGKHKQSSLLAILLTLIIPALFAQDGASLGETVIESVPAPAVPVPTTEQRPAAPTAPIEAAPVVNVEAVPEVPVTVATKTPKLEVPSVETTSISTLREYQRFTVNDTLRQLSGTSLVQNGGPGTVTGLSIRGLNSDQNLVLLNGRRLPPGLAGQYQLEFFEVSTLESVQVLKGAASSLYGAEAIGGVVDLRSTDARFVETNGVSLYSEAGSFNTFRSGGIASFRDGRVGGVIEAATISTNGDRPNSKFENGTLRGNFAFDLADGVWVDLLGFVQSGEVGVPGSDFQNANFPADQLNINDSYLVSPRLTIERENWNAEMYFSYNQNDLENLNTPTFFGFGVDGSLQQIGREAEARFNYTGIEDTTLTIGGGYFGYSFTQLPIGTTTFVTPATREQSYKSIFGQVDTLLPGEINLTTSVRFDDHDSFEDATTYSIAAQREIEATGTKVFGKYSTGYRAPTGQDLLFIVDPSGIDPLNIDPEESTSWEVGIKQPLLDGRASLGITYFQNDFENSIEFDPVTFGASTVDGATSGFEIEGLVEVFEDLNVYTNYTYLDTEVTGGAGNLSGLPGDRLARRPRHVYNFGAVITKDDWNFGVEIHSEFDRFDRSFEPRFADDFISTRLFGSYELNDRLEVYGRVENLFDEDYIFTRGFAAPGFGIFGGVRVNFGE